MSTEQSLMQVSPKGPTYGLNLNSRVIAFLREKEGENFTISLLKFDRNFLRIPN